MQLVWSDVLKKKLWILDIIDTYFSAMQNQNVGKSSTRFQEIAAELNNIVVANQTYQTTCFVRSLLREHSYMTSDVFWAFLTYLPTLIRYFTT